MKKKIQLLFVFFTFSLYGQELHSNFVHNWVYKSEESDLMPPNGSVTDVDGITWIGTEMGLLRYDGLNVEKVIDNKYPQISTQRVKRVSKDIAKGEVYFTAFPNNDWFRIKKGRIEEVIPNGSTFYINTDNKKVIEFDDKRLKALLLQRHIPKDILSIFNKTSVLEVKSFIKTKQFLYIHMFDEVVVIDLEKKYTVSSFPLSLENLLFSCGETVFFFKKKKFHQLEGSAVVNSNVATNVVMKQFAANYEITHPDNNRFIVTETGESFIIFENRLYKVEVKKNVLQTIFIEYCPSNDVNDLNYYAAENLFLLSCFVSGLSKFTNNQFNQLVFKDPNLINYSVVPINEDVVYSSAGWFYNLTTKEFKNDSYSLNRNKYFILDKEKEVYVQIENRILNVKNSNDSLLTDRKNHLGYYSSSTFFDNRLWISQASENNLLYYGDTKKITTDLFITEKLNGKTITFMIPKHDELLIATMEGLYAYQPKIKKIRFYKQFGKKYIRRIIKITENSFWVCCYGDGLYLFDNGKFYKVKVDHSDFSAVHTMEEDALQNLWISTNNGLFTVGKKEIIIRTLQGKLCSLYKFSVKDGLLTNEFNGGSTHPSFKNEKGLIGFASMKGVLWFDPFKIKKSKFTGAIYVDDVLSDGKSIAAKEGIYGMESDAHLISMKLFYPYYHNRENLVVQYRIEGQKEWQDLLEDKIVFTRERKGSVEVKVRIYTKGFGVDSSIQKSFQFYFAPRIYETTWFLVLCFFLLLGLLALSFKIGLILNKKKRRNLEEKIRKKTVELEETNKMLYESREGISKSLKEKELLLKEIHHRVKNNLQLVISLLNIQGRKNNYQTIEDFLEKGQTRIMAMVLIHENLYQNESIEQLNVEKYLESLVQKVLDSFGIENKEISVSIAAKNITLNLQTAIPFGLMINEFVTNSLKYAFPEGKGGQIQINVLKKSEADFELTMSDNGIGFAPEQLKKKTFGLELIRLLTSQLNGEVRMTTTGSTSFYIRFQESLV